jgi:type II secretory pathway component GspD/PulD (secretin)
MNLRIVIVINAALVCHLAIMVRPVSAQGSELDLLRNDSIRQQLGLSTTQQEQLTEASKGGSPGREVFDPFLQRMKDTDDEAERTKIREEMQQAISKARDSAGTKALTILDSRQLKLLRSLYIQQAGVRVFSDARVAADLGLTDEQKQRIGELADLRRDASRSVDFSASPDQQEAFRKEWEDKFLAVLTDEQRTKWTEQSGPAAANAGVPTPIVAGGQNPPVTGTAMPESSSPPPGAEVVSSFGSTSDAAGEDQIVEKFSFNFRYAPWDQVLQGFATGAGYTLDMNQVPPGTFSHIDRNEYNADQAMDVLNGYLQRKGYALVLKDGFLVCLNVDKTIPPNLIPDVSVDDLMKVENGDHAIQDNEIVRLEIPLEKLDVGVMAQEVEQLIGPIGTMTAFTQTGSLIIADTGSNLRRIKNYIDTSVARRKGDLIFKAYPLTNIDAEEAEFMLLSQFGMRQGVANVSEGGRDRDRDRDRQSPASPASATANLQVMSDARTNSLFVTGSPDQQALVEEIVKVIDVPLDPNSDRARSTGPYLRVYKVSGRADQVAQSITAMMPGVVVNEDGSAGTVHIFGTAKQHEQVEEWVRAFSDGSGAAGTVAVIPLAKMDPLSAAATLRNLFIAEGANAPTIETDLYGNRIIVKGTGVQVEQIKKVLLELGEDGTGVKQKGEGGTIRRYSLRGRDPEEFFPYLQQEWARQEKSSINIVVPRRAGPIRDLKTPTGETRPESRERQNGVDDNSQTRLNNGRIPIRKQSGYFPVSRTQDEAVEPPQANAPAGQQTFNADGVTIVVDGDEVILLGKDEDALDRLEETMDYLQQSIPYRTKWTVFYLQSADATEAAALLEELMPGSSVTSTSGSSGFGLSSMFSPITQSVSDMTGLSGIGANPQTLRIIPDPRSNSLFVTGPKSLVDEAEGMLAVLDSNDIPESMRELQPRRIEVKYAEIDEIATMVNDAFKPYMEPPGGRQQQNNPLAQMFGGGGGGSKANEPQGIQMTVAVDRMTSSLIVSSNEALFEKVRTMVTEVDDAAKLANRTVRVVQLQHSDATVVQQSLTSLFPRVTSSATRPSSSTTNSAGTGSNTSGDRSGGDRGNSSQQPSADPFRQMMEDRMRSSRGGDSGSSRGGSSPFGGGFSPFGGSPFGSRGGSPFGGGRGGR